MRYREALHVGEWNLIKDRIIDFIFNKGNVSEVYWDFWNHAAYGSDSYSDHGVAAALLEDEDTTPPINKRVSWEVRPNGRPRLFGWWSHYGGWDGGTGLKYWAIYRRQSAADEWDLIARTRDRHYLDMEVMLGEGDSVQYRVAAVDRAGNMSKFIDVTVSN
jgi:hypothetical protein